MVIEIKPYQSMNTVLDKIKPYLKDKNYAKKSVDWKLKIELTIAIKFVSSKDTDEEHKMHSNVDNRSHDLSYWRTSL